MDAKKSGGFKAGSNLGEQLITAEKRNPITTSIYIKSNAAQEVPDQNTGRAGNILRGSITYCAYSFYLHLLLETGYWARKTFCPT